MLFFYSGDVPELDNLLLQALGPDHNLLVIPYSPNEMWAAREGVAYFRQAGIHAHKLTRSEYLDADSLRGSVMAADAVFLSGGNTYEFLSYAREVDLFEILTLFEAKGGIIASESAGSILLSPDISTAGLPDAFADDNHGNLTDFSAMGRVAFHFHPHHDPKSEQFDEEMAQLQHLANQSALPVILLQDGHGLVMRGDGEIVHIVGEHEFLSPSDIVEPVVLQADFGLSPSS